jgi:GTP pyrophosphokinase
MMLTQRYRDALTFAFDLHARQERQGSGIPYITHLLSVSSLVMEYGGDEAQAIAGLLHDAAEDQGGAKTLALIGARFGSDVADMVAACTDSIEEVRPPWRRRKELYLAHLPTVAPRSQLVSVCDKIHNARCIRSDLRLLGDGLWERFTGGKEGVLWYYAALARAFTIDTPAVEELRRTVNEIVQIAGNPT